MVWIFLLINLSVLVASSGVRYNMFGLAEAVSAEVLVVVPIIALLCSAILVFKAIRHRARPRLTAFSELMLVFPAFFAFEWLFLPAYRWRVVDWLVITALLVLIALMMYRDRRNFGEWGVTGRNFLPALRKLALPTMAMVAVPIAMVPVVGTDFELSRLAGAMLYPLYALGQLLIFQVFLVRRLRRISDSDLAVILVSAAIFAMLHWPNGPVMIACFLAALVWTWVYLRRPDVLALALSMGIAAATFVTVLPRDFTQHMRTGPIYVQRILDADAPAPPDR